MITTQRLVGMFFILNIIFGLIGVYQASNATDDLNNFVSKWVNSIDEKLVSNEEMKDPNQKNSGWISSSYNSFESRFGWIAGWGSKIAGLVLAGLLPFSTLFYPQSGFEFLINILITIFRILLGMVTIFELYMVIWNNKVT